MARYLLVPAKASSLPALVARARELATGRGHTSFVLLTPLPRTTPDRDVAEHLASANEVLAVAQLERARLHVERSGIGDRAPLLAIEDELRAHPDTYDAIVLASPAPSRLARLIARDDHWRAESLPVPVIHVFEDATVLLPMPITQRLRRLVAGPIALLDWIARQLRRPRMGIAVLLLPMIAYLIAGAGLVIFVNRRFMFNEVLAFLLYSALVVAVVVIERSPPPHVESEREDREDEAVRLDGAR